MTTLAIPYTLENDDGPLAPDYRPEVSVELSAIVELFEDVEATEAEDDEIVECLLECVREDFVGTISPVVGQATLEALVKQVREALQIRDTEHASTHGA
jgi:hypothetical protein